MPFFGYINVGVTAIKKNRSHHGRGISGIQNPDCQCQHVKFIADLRDKLPAE